MKIRKLLYQQNQNVGYQVHQYGNWHDSSIDDLFRAGVTQADLDAAPAYAVRGDRTLDSADPVDHLIFMGPLAGSEMQPVERIARSLRLSDIPQLLAVLDSGDYSPTFTYTRSNGGLELAWAN